MKTLAFIIIFLLFGAFFIISNENLALKDSNKRVTFARNYYAWFVGLAGNLKSITGYVIQTKWLPQEQIKNLSNNK